MPGWPGNGAPTWGYHGDDGHKFARSGSGDEYSVRYGPGDIVGCGVNFTDGIIFYTKNGTLLRKDSETLTVWSFADVASLATAFEDVRGRLFPTLAWDQAMEFGFGPILGSRRMCRSCINLNNDELQYETPIDRQCRIWCLCIQTRTIGHLRCGQSSKSSSYHGLGESCRLR